MIIANLTKDLQVLLIFDTREVKNATIHPGKVELVQVPNPRKGREDWYVLKDYQIVGACITYWKRHAELWYL